MRFSFFAAMITLAGSLAACGGSGGGGGSNPNPAITSTPVGNTALPYYLPLASGNSWTFLSGGKIVDLGTEVLTCACPHNGGDMERLAVYPPNSTTISSSFFVTKNTPSGGTQLTNLLGVENDSGTGNITLASSSLFPYGIPIMDDTPSANESWNDGAGNISAIVSIGGTMSLPTGVEIVNVATNEITGNFEAITWAFARGVGFTSIAVGTQSTSLSSFNVNTITSSSIAHQSKSGKSGPIGIGRYGKPNYDAALRHLFGT